MSNELESDRAMVMNLESVGVDGVGYDETEAAPGALAGAHFNSGPVLCARLRSVTVLSGSTR
jgi:hypothetical protein